MAHLVFLCAMDQLLEGLKQGEVLRFLIAIGIGVLMGMERESSKKGDGIGPEIFAGVRTFPLITILGYLCMFLTGVLSHWIFTLGALSFIAFVIVSYVMSYQREQTGGTTQMAMIIAFMLGGMVQAGYAGLAIIGSVVVTGLLALKIQLHTAIGKIAQKDIFALLQFVVLSVLIYPLLPDQTFGPFDVLNPSRIWRIVIIILAIDFLGYLLAKFIGTKRGTIITGVLGGFASSTAVAWTFSRRSRKDEAHVGEYAGGIVLASSIMFPRILIWLFIWNQTLFWDLLLPILLIGTVGVSAGVYLIRREDRKEEGMGHQPKNPLNLISAFSFGVLYAAILLLVAFAEENFGDKGVYLASGISGLTDVDAITISMSKLGGERFEFFVSHLAIVIGAISNSLLKYGVCLTFGSPSMRKRISMGFLPIIGASLLYLLIKGLILG